MTQRPRRWVGGLLALLLHAWASGLGGGPHVHGANAERVRAEACAIRPDSRAPASSFDPHCRVCRSVAPSVLFRDPCPVPSVRIARVGDGLVTAVVPVHRGLLNTPFPRGPPRRS